MEDMYVKALSLSAVDKYKIETALNLTVDKMTPPSSQVKILFNIYNEHISNDFTNKNCNDCRVAVMHFWVKASKLWTSN